MDLNQYQRLAITTLIKSKNQKESKLLLLSYLILGLSNEAGEVAGKLKKIIRGDVDLTPEVISAISFELGDVFWYLVTTAHELGIDLETIANDNLDKLFSRKERGVIQGNGDNR